MGWLSWAIAWSKREIAAGRDPNRHASRGTELHAIAAQAFGEIAEDCLNRNRFKRTAKGDTKPEIEPWLEPLLKGLRAATARLGRAIATETYIEAQWYAGTLDALLESGTVLDIKTVQSLAGWRGDESAWLNAAPAERRAWLQVLGYCNAVNLADEELCSGVTQGALLVVSPEAFVLKVVRFEEGDLEMWGELEPVDESRFNLFERYRRAIAQRERRQAEVGERGAIASRFGFS